MRFPLLRAAGVAMGWKGLPHSLEAPDIGTGPRWSLIRQKVVNTMIDICNELSNNPPFPGWKDGLDELWN